MLSAKEIKNQQGKKNEQNYLQSLVFSFSPMEQAREISLPLGNPVKYHVAFSEPVTFRNLYHMFFASVGLSLGLFYFILFSCTLFWVSV